MGIKCITKDCPFEVVYDGPWIVTGHEAFFLKPMKPSEISQTNEQITLKIGEKRLKDLKDDDLLTIKSPESSRVQDAPNSILPFTLKVSKTVKKSIFLTCQAKHTNLYYISIDE
ncbi:hypothetical protein [Dyadobacter frigoris]|uniref:Uncharacterized protein n=1 Tax=Dyadobacter frigoris TaxID=2576211 RepID=A0A4U6D7Z9_9BACT|nr:hypothetical protein [Dyadobacter frigoris]TKT92675.1 hypothetical protein FDK13_07630 [Dyadobacter frigoris]